MATLYENFSGTPNSDKSLTSTTWPGQTFTTTSAHLMSSFKVKLKNSGISTGTVTGKLYTTSGGLPNTLIVDSNTVNNSSIGSSYSLIEFTLSTPQSLSNSTLYALVVKRDGTESGGTLNFGAITSGGYGSGNFFFSNGTSGGSWTNVPAQDAPFEIYDNSSVEISGSDSATGSVSGSAILSFQWVSGSISSTGFMSGTILLSITVISGSVSATGSIVGSAVVSLRPQSQTRNIVAIGTQNDGQGCLYYGAA